jgi:hypothetical protein
MTKPKRGERVPPSSSSKNSEKIRGDREKSEESRSTLSFGIRVVV